MKEQKFESLITGFMQNAELEKKFPEEVVSEMKFFSEQGIAKDKNRENFTHLNVVCIDPEGAKDHDDAISIEETKDGYILGVHIADVSHFVRAGSATDKEAAKRGYTQYLPWTAVPMLPHILSSNLCSLMENEARFTFSCIITLNKKGDIRKYRFAKGLIKVSHSITYKQAAELFAKKNKDICLLALVAAKLKKNREENGMLEMDSAEYQCEFNKKGEPLRIIQRKSDISNSWIEECMLAANKCCAIELQKKKLRGIYRIHAAPDPEDIMELMQNEPTIFFNSPINPHKLLKSYSGENSQDKRIFDLYSHLVKKAKNNPQLTNKILRSMQKALYSTECTGHFALHWKDYAHFTSPIRRYADLWCHRELSGCKGAVKRASGSELCSKLNEAEIKNQKIERKALKLCTSYILQRYVGQTFKAEIQGVEEFGIFISISCDAVALADGLVHLRDIPGDYYIYNETKGILVGKRSGKIFKRGDKITVKLIKANPAKGENDFIIETVGTGRGKAGLAQQDSPWKGSQKKRRFGR